MTTDALTTAAGPVQPVKSTASVASDYGYPNGHLGHLGDFEQEAFAKFKAVLEERGLYKPGPPPSHDDTILLRFLRARRWVVEDAFKQFKETEDWRAANDIGVLYRTIDVKAYEDSRRMYPQWTGRRDRRGIPLYVFEIKTLDSKAVANYEKTGATTTFSDAKSDGKTPPGMLRLFALYENLVNFVMPFCTQLQDRESPGTPISMTTNIVDISGVSLRQFWNLKAHMQAASTLATAHYPETLDRIFIIGAPVFFSTVWGWIKRWFDPITVSKIFILSPSEVKPVLESFIERRNIPKRYGGELDYNYGELGNPDPGWEGHVEWANGHDHFPSGPMVWRTIDDGTRLECIGIGRVDGKERNEKICTVTRTYSPQWESLPIEPSSAGAAAEAETTTAANPAPVETGPSKEVADKAAETEEKIDAQPPRADNAEVNGIIAEETNNLIITENAPDSNKSGLDTPSTEKQAEVSEKVISSPPPALPTTVL